MATALTAQLAQIAASSTNQLDLKSQRKAHSQSLIFDQNVAISQDFDTLYQVCVEGFQELCLLDARLLEFTRSLFSEQSKREERSQMTAAQNQELDQVLERCLTLLGAKIMLKPTVKALEWLVRRFRVHEYNTACVILTLLPYHTLPLFTTFLSIVPKKLSRSFKFLHPYVESLATPPRHTIVYAATNNSAFFSAWNSYVLRCCRSGFQYHSMVSYWATVVTEAITGQLDQAATGSREAQRRKEEDVLLTILPILNEGLSLQKVVDLKIGCYMILSVVVSKANLDDRVLVAMMEAIIDGHAEETTPAELICLAIIAQRRDKSKLPKKIFKAIMTLDNIEDDILTMSKRYIVDKLVLGLVLGVLRGLSKKADPRRLRFVETMVENELLRESHIPTAVQAVLSVASDTDFLDTKYAPIQSQLAELILRLVRSEKFGERVRSAIQESKIDMRHIEMRLQTVLEPPTGNGVPLIQDTEMVEAGDVEAHETFSSMKNQIPMRTVDEISFLSHSESYIYESLARAFIAASNSPADLEEFVNLPVLQKSLANEKPLFITFFARFWCGTYHTSPRAAALSYMCDYFKGQNVTSDLQLLLPYILYALCDKSTIVRQAAVDLILALAPFYTEGEHSGSSNSKPILGKDDVYGQGEFSQSISWLSANDLNLIFNRILVPELEECRLDHQHIMGIIEDTLKGSKHSKAPKTSSQDLRTQFRVATFLFLSSHSINTPLYAIKLGYLQAINRIHKVGNISKTKTMMPLLAYHERQTEERLKTLCRDSEIDKTLFLSQLAEVVSPTDREGIKVLQNIIALEQSSPPSSLREAALRRIQTIWTTMKHDSQLSLSETLFLLACNAITKKSNDCFGFEAMDVLRNVSLSSTTLLDLLTKVSLIPAEADETSSSKRRKTSQGHFESEGGDSQINENALSNNLKQVTFALELIEGSKNGNNSPLLHDLFYILSDMQYVRTHLGTDLSYSLSLVLSCLLSIVENARTSPTLQLERSYIKADLIIDCFKATSNPQVQHAALLLLSSLAHVVPEVIIHSVMPVFTFMGTTTLRQSDEYSAHVINQTIESVIPPLISSLRTQKGGTLAGTSELFLSFAAAFEHIPSHRRLTLFATLVDKVGPEDHLFALLVILVDRYGISNKTIYDFVVGLSNQCTSLIQLITAEKCLEVVVDCLKPKPTISSYLIFSDQNGNRANTASNILTLSSWIIKNPRLSSRISKLLELEDTETERIRLVYSRLTEQALQFTSDIQSSRKFPIAYDELLDSLFQLLTLNEFLRSLETLLTHGSNVFQLRVLKVFEQRIDSAAIGDQKACEACLNFVPKLLSLLNESTDVVLKQTAIACCDCIAEKYGKTNVKASMSIANIVSDNTCLGAVEPQLRLMSLLCLTTLIDVIREEMIPVIPRILSKSLQLLEATITESSMNHEIQNAAFSVFSSLFLYIPWMMTGEHLDRLLEAAYHSANSKLSTPCEKSRKDALDLLAKQGTPQECIAALTRTWDNVVTEGFVAIGEYLNTVVTLIQRHSKSIIMKYSQQLVGLFLQVLDLRRIQESLPEDGRFTDEQTDSIEQALNRAIIQMIYKLNDTNFRPLFSQMSDWATSSISKKEGKVFRKISWYSFLQAFFGTLKSIVTSYASFIVDDASEVLSSFTPAQPESSKLWSNVINTLSAAFEHDQDEFWQSPTRFTTISKPLLHQFNHATPNQTATSLIPCITALATTANSSDHHKTINTAILAYMRSDSPSTRLAAVRCEISLTEKLGEEWLNLLPEMLPFVAEAMEDGDEEIETEVRRWVRIIEEILGESLDSMLQ